MAVNIISPFSDPSLYDRFFLEAFEPDDLARLEARKAWVAKETEAHEMQVLVVERRSLFYTWFLELPMHKDHTARTLRFRKGKRVGDLVQSSPNERLVSEDVKRVIEEVDPNGDGHRFFPVNIVHKNGDAYDGTYYAWTVHRKLDALHPDSPGLYFVDPSKPATTGLMRKSGFSETRDNLWVKKDVIGDCCAWYDPRGLQILYISDRLHEAFRDHKFTGFDVGAEWAEV